MNNKRNFVAGVFSSGWSALTGLVAVPWYIHYLGIEAYGMIGVHLTIQSIFVLLDLGISPAVSREVARSSVNNAIHYARTLVHTMAVLFTISGLVIAGIAAALAPWLARNWLNAGNLPVGDVALAIGLSAIAVGLRWPATLYVGVLNGARRIDLASAVTIVTTTLANVGAIMVIAFVEPSLRAFFIWQALIGAMHSVAMRAVVRHVLGSDGAVRFDGLVARSIWRFAAGMAGVSATGILFSQIDKIVLMRTTTLSEIGYYTIALSLAGILYRIITPAFNIVYPQLCIYIEEGIDDALRNQYNRLTKTFLTFIFPCSMALVVSADPILNIWISDKAVTSRAFLLTQLLTVGTTIHCIMYFPYALQIASGRTLIPLMINIILSILFLPLVVYFSLKMGAEGAAISWVVLHICYFFLGTWLTHRHLLVGNGLQWVFGAILPPLVVSLGIGFAAWGTMFLVASDIGRLLVGAIAALAALASGALLLPEGRGLIKRGTSGLAVW